MPVELSHADKVKTFAHVVGAITSAPLDLAARMDDLVARLRRDGWLIAGYSVDTDFGDFLPTPGAKRLDMYLHRADIPIAVPQDALQAEIALVKTLSTMAFEYNPIARYAGELVTNIGAPSVSGMGKLAVAALVVYAGFELLKLLRRR